MFRALHVHNQEVELYWCSIWYRPLSQWPSGAQVGREQSSLPTCAPKQSNYGSLTSYIQKRNFANIYTGLFISPSGISELDCATTKTDTAERSISIGRESLQVFFFLVLGALAYFQVPPLGGSREEKWRSQ